MGTYDDDRRYTCLDCRCQFAQPRTWRETHGLEHGPYETHLGCPECGGAFIPTLFCDQCGQPITDDYVTVGDYHYCDNCFTLHSMPLDW